MSAPRANSAPEGSTSGGVVYCVSPGTFECSCPDAHRRGQGRGCKHSLAVYIL
jgi:hypothetical protein